MSAAHQLSQQTLSQIYTGSPLSCASWPTPCPAGRGSSQRG